MSNATTDSLELERQLAEAIDNFFETARKHDFCSAQGVTYLATTCVDEKIFGFRRRERQEKLTHSLAYELRISGSDFEDGLLLAVEGIFIQRPPAYTRKWPFSIQRPRATEDLINQINFVTSRIAP